MVYKKCSKCGKKIEQYTECECMVQAKKESYKRYKDRRMLDKEEKKRQEFYVSKAWLTLSNLIKNHFFGICVLCWLRGLIVSAVYTHHIEETDKREDLMLSEDNLLPLCASCHKMTHGQYSKGSNAESNMKKILVDAIIKFDKEYYE